MHRNGSGRFSPINSPTRHNRSKEAFDNDRDNYVDDDDTGNDEAPPPSYRSSSDVNHPASPLSFRNNLHPSSPSPSVTSKTSVTSKYSSLMQFLDDVSGDSGSGGVTARNPPCSSSNGSGRDRDRDRIDDTRGADSVVSCLSTPSGTDIGNGNGHNISSSHSHRRIGSTRSNSGGGSGGYNGVGKSNRQLPSSSSVSMSSSNYVWDQWNDNDNDNDNHDVFGDRGEGEGATYFSLPPHHLSSSDDQSVASSSLPTVVSELSTKIQIMKTELQEKTKISKELHAELTRLKSAYKKRVDKVQSRWESELGRVREDAAVAVRKQTEFVETTRDNTKQLAEKAAVLSERLSKAESSREEAVGAVRRDGNKRRQRAMRQLESDEKQSFEKLSSSKSEGMRKAAADEVGPRLEALVHEGKEKVRVQQEEADRALRHLSRQLEEDMDGRLRESEMVLRASLSDEEVQRGRIGERRRGERQQQHKKDLEAVHERFERQKRTLEEAAERTARIDLEAAIEARKGQRSSELRQLQEETASQQRELATLMESLSGSRGRLKGELEAEEDRWREEARRKRTVRRESREMRVKSGARAEAERDTERVRTRMIAEVESDRVSMKTRMDGEVNDVRLRVERRASSRRVELRQEVNRIKDNAHRLHTAVSHLQSQLRDLRLTLSEKESELEETRSALTRLTTHLEYDEDNDNAARDTVAAGSGGNVSVSLSVWERKVEDVEKEIRIQGDTLKQELEQEEHTLDETMSQVRDKVRMVLRRKEQAVREARVRLGEVQGLVTSRSDQLEQLRTAKFADDA
eukprot:gene6451-13033_t